MRYCDYYNLSSSSGTPAVHQWRLNSTYDPDFTSTGHQPMFRDNYATIYGSYLVTACTVTLRMALNTTSTNAVMAVVRPVWNTSATPALTSLEAERPGGHQLVVVSDKVTTFKRRYVTHEVAGLTWSQYFTSNIYSTAQGSYPALTCFLNLIVQSLDITTTTVVDVFATFELEVYQLNLLQNQSQN